jgi:hypothetical protein
MGPKISRCISALSAGASSTMCGAILRVARVEGRAGQQRHHRGAALAGIVQRLQQPVELRSSMMLV